MGQITVTFELHTVLQIQTPSGSISRLTHQMQIGECVGDALQKLGLVVNVDETLIVVDRQNVSLEYQPKDGDVIHLIPAIAGG